MRSCLALGLQVIIALLAMGASTCCLAADRLVQSPGKMTYLVDPATGNDANPAGKPWKTYGKLNSVRLAPGDLVVISPGRQDETLKPSGAGTAELPVTLKFLPGVHTIGKANALQLPLFISNSCDTPAPKPIGICLQKVQHFRLEGGGVEGPGKTMILYDGRMIMLLNDEVENVTLTGLVFDLKRTTVSEIRVLEVGPASAVIQVAEASEYAIDNGQFRWRGDWLPGAFTQVLDLAKGTCRRVRNAPRGWKGDGQYEAVATDLGGRKVRLVYPDGDSGLTVGQQYHFRNTRRDTVGVHNARSKNIVLRDCDFYALTGMGLVSQFTENITYERVHVAPPKDSIRTCAAWADIFHFSNCKGEILVDSCRLSGMQDDAINCHGTYLQIVETVGVKQLLVRFIHRQTYGFAPYTPGDEIAVMSSATLREYPKNPRATVTAVERKTDRDWLITLAGPVPAYEPQDIIDNLTWNPRITARNNQVSVNPVRGFLFGTREPIIVQGNTFQSCAREGILVEGDGSKWMESSPVRKMLIEGNTFIGCGVAIEANINERKPEAPVHENIRIIGNTFEGGQGIHAKSVKGLVISGNRSRSDELKVRVEASCTDVQIDNKQNP